MDFHTDGLYRTPRLLWGADARHVRASAPFADRPRANQQWDRAVGTLWTTGLRVPPLQPPVYTGDTFTLSASDGFTLTPAFNGVPNCFQITHGAYCDFNVAWSESDGVLDSISIQFQTQVEDLTIGLTGGTLGTAETSGAGCGIHSICDVTGFWQSDLLPEPMSARLLLRGLLGLVV